MATPPKHRTIPPAEPNSQLRRDPVASSATVIPGITAIPAGREMLNDSGSQEAFAEDIAQDLLEGRLLELAELYAVGALGSPDETAIDQFLQSAPAPLRRRFSLRVLHTREALMVAYGTCEAEPPANLLDRILASLPISPSKN